jgi:geranyl-CoA carboxylase alpha subunit
VSYGKILVANRGEIACRVMRTARRLGYRTVAVHSEPDATAPHVALADEAVLLGPGAAPESYLRADRILEAARRTGADAVHPGYGFLSESADFSQACNDASLVFIGPPPSAIAAMGDKAGAKRRMIAAGVPCAPGYLDDDQTDERLLAEGAKLGVPMLVKAVAGGGGRGMRLVRSLDELPAALAGARREALSSFGNARLMLERLVEGGRHIEIQVFADRHGNVIHLGERDCTTQRRRQKVIEEAPSPIVDVQMRSRMGADAVAAATAVGYVGAGTVEFIVDGGLRHYFLEMNTRLQVEHPVTECITGLDLVEWQLRVAAGDPLPLTQDQVRFEGHAIEARLYAEDPYAGFAPQTGHVLHWRPETARRTGVRIDSGISERDSVTPCYDAMVAKLIAHGRDRSDALRRLVAAIEDAPLIGVRNNGRFLRDLLRHPDFLKSEMHTATLDHWAEHREPLLVPPAIDASSWRLAAALFASRCGAGWRPASVAAWDVTLMAGGDTRTLRVLPQGDHVQVTADGSTTNIRVVSWQDHQLRYLVDGVQRKAVCLVDGDALHLVQDGNALVVREASPWPSDSTATDPRFTRAPVAGTVAAISVRPGDVVTAGQQLLCIEAMKMEMWLPAHATGTVLAVHVELKQSIEAGTVLVEIEAAGAD